MKEGGGEDRACASGFDRFAEVFDRARPAVHHGVVSDTEYDETPSQWNQSFFSGDTSFAFALASSAATLSFLRDYRSAPWVVFARRPSVS